MTGDDVDLPSRGDVYRRKRDGVLYEVVHIGSFSEPDRIQIRKHGAKNLKNTNWLSAESLAERYEASDIPPPPTLAERVADEIGVPSSARGSVKLYFEPSAGAAAWGPEAVEFVRRYGPDASWSWMNVPESAKRERQDGFWWLTMTATFDGVSVEMKGMGGWTTVEARALTESLKAAKGESQPPEVPPDRVCPRCAYGWNDD